LAAANIGFAGTPHDQRCSDRIETVTLDRVFNWKKRAGLSGSVQGVCQ